MGKCDLYEIQLSEINHYLYPLFIQNNLIKYKMHTDSIQTEYYEQNDPISYSNAYQRSTYADPYKKQMSPSDSNVAFKIQQNIKDYHEQIKKNKDVINQLQCQRKFFEKLSQKQKHKIENFDINKLRLDYENQICQIKNQTSELHQVISRYHEEQLQNQESFSQTHVKIVNNKEFLMQTLIGLEKQNENYEVVVENEESQRKQMEDLMVKNKKTIKQKQSIHRKYVELQIQIERLEKRLNQPKKRA